MSDCSGAEVFALQVLGQSMAPEFDEGEIIVIEPDGALRDGSFVLALLDGEWLFRQLRREGDGWRLHALTVRTNHVHAVVSADEAPEKVMTNFKIWATRRLREHELLDPEPSTGGRVSEFAHSGIGEINGDGVGDIAIGAPNNFAGVL